MGAGDEGRGPRRGGCLVTRSLEKETVKQEDLSVGSSQGSLIHTLLGTAWINCQIGNDLTGLLLARVPVPLVTAFQPFWL